MSGVVVGTGLAAILADLDRETSALDEILMGLRDESWALSTPAVGWSIRDQVTHLAFFDETALCAATDPAGFADHLAKDGVQGLADRVADQHRTMSGGSARDWFLRSRSALLAAFGDVDETARVPWYAADMGIKSLATARLMETWAHGQDIVDALGIERAPTDRLRHVADLGVRTLRYSFQVNDRPSPHVPVRVELDAPSGAQWIWGPEEARDVVRGSALDFCLLTTRRRHRDDTTLVAKGAVADLWLSLAQAYAGSPGTGRQPSGSVRREVDS